MKRIVILILALLAVPRGWSQEMSIPMLALQGSSPTALPAPWELKKKTGQPEYRIQKEEGLPAVCLTSRSSSFSIQRRAELDPGQFPLLTWQWLASVIPQQGDLRDRDADDQAAQLFVVFEGGEAISYVWDSNAPTGTITETSIPFLLTLKIVVIESGPARLRTWQTYERNLKEDYKRFFGDGELPRIEALRFQINSQYTRSTARSCIASITFRRHRAG